MSEPGPHHDGSPLYVTNPHPELDERVTVFLRVPDSAGVDAVHLRFMRDGEAEYDAAVVDRRVGAETWWRATVDVVNPVTNYRWLLGGSGGYRWVNGTGVQAFDPTDASDFRLTVHPPAPAWVTDAVVYQIFPDRFAKSSEPRELPAWATPAAWDDPVLRGGDAAMYQLYGGDLTGIRQRLDHLVDLGVDVIYLTPFFPAESNHRYNATRFDVVDPVLGGDAALAALSHDAHQRGLRLLGDITPNHSGDTHEWFRRAQADPASTEAAFYTFDEHPHEYVSWLGVPTLPKFDHRSDALRRRMYEGPESVVAHWLRPPFSLDGWRVDVANMTGRHGAVDLAHDVARAFRHTMAAVNPDTYLVAEHGFDASADLLGDGWHGTMNYAGFTRPVWSWLGRRPEHHDFLGMPVPVPSLDGDAVASTIDAFRAAIPWQAFMANLNLLGSHDTARFRTVAEGRDRHLAAAALLFTMPGVPLLFAGDEIGLEGADNEDARQPFPWDQRRWDTATLDTYRALIALRRTHPALRTGGFRWVRRSADTLVFERELPDERLLVQVSRGAHAGVPVPAWAEGAESVAGGAGLQRGGSLPADGPGFDVWIAQSASVR